MQKITLFTGQEMYVKKDDKGLSADLIRDGIRENSASEFFLGIIKPDMIIYEIGANLGYFMLLEQHKLQDTGFIYAFEPVPSNVECLKKNIKLHNFQNIRVFDNAVGDENKKVKLLVTKKSNCGTAYPEEEMSDIYRSIIYDNYTVIEEIFVEQIKLDSFTLSKEVGHYPPDIIRFDVEGYEIKIVDGAKETLNDMNTGSYLFIEFHPVVFKDNYGGMKHMMDVLNGCGFYPVWANGATDFGDDFANWSCHLGGACPRTFLVKK